MVVRVEEEEEEEGRDGPKEDLSSFLPGLESSISAACLAWATGL